MITDTGPVDEGKTRSNITGKMKPIQHDNMASDSEDKQTESEQPQDSEHEQPEGSDEGLRGL